MHTVGAMTAWLAGAVLGLLVLGMYPHGLDTRPGWFLLACALLLFVPLYLARRDVRTRWVCIFSIALLGGCGRALITYPPPGPDALAYYNGSEHAPPVTLVGSVESEPVFSDRAQRVRVRVTGLVLPNRGEVAVSGSLLAFLPRYPEHPVGERLSLTGVLTAPPEIEAFDYPAYLGRAGIYSYLRFPKVRSLGQGETSMFPQLIAAAREQARRALKASVAEPMASLATGVVIGDRSTIPTELQEAFTTSGTVHVLAISGQNIALLVGFVWLLFGRGRRHYRLPPWATLLLLTGLSIYTVFTGATPSVVRASIMAGVLLLAPLVGRRYDPLAALAVSAVVMVALDPDLLADAGFELSFGAMLGIILVGPALMGYVVRLPFVERSAVARAVMVALVTGMAAQTVTLPIIAALTGRVSLVSPLATQCIDFALLPLMVSGIFTVLAYPLWQPLAFVIGAFAWLCGAWMAWVVRAWSALPGASFPVAGFAPSWAVLYYVALFALLNLRRLRDATSLITSSLGTRQALGLAGAALACSATVFLLLAG